MPPKAKSSAPSKKTELKKKEKVIEDKTFGLKNKKGAKQQKFIQQVQHQVKHGGAPARKVEDQKKTDVLKKEEKKKEQAELNQLFKPVITQKVEKGADPKSVLCAFFKQGLCAKGDKCKFSHDLQIERKAEKRSAYVDLRDENEGDAEVNEDPDGKGTKTKIICKFFLEALETNKFGWFWECPNGDKCVYRHALPAGYVLEKDKKKDEKKEEISIEDLVERERAALGAELTRVTLETFLAWKKKKILERQALLKKDEARRKADFKAGKSVGISGREMFTFRPELATDDQMEDEEVAYDTRYLPHEEDDEEEEPHNVKELTLESVASVAQEVDNTGTQATSLNRMQEKVTQNSEAVEGAIGGSDQTNGEVNAMPIDENLFLDDDDDLDELEEELGDMLLQENGND